MPASLDLQTRLLVLLICSITSAMIIMPLLWANAKMPGIKVEARQASAALYESARGAAPGAGFLPVGCAGALGLMASATAAIALPLLAFSPQPGPGSAALPAAPASINFCEEDFAHLALIAEPVNFVSALTSYVPLALLGLAGPAVSPSRVSRRFVAMNLGLLSIGLGSAALHALLSAVAQGGDELPMLWWMASTTYCAMEVSLQMAGSNIAGSQGLRWLIAGTALVATSVYVAFREHFAVFFAMFAMFAATTIFCLAYCCVRADFSVDHGVRGRVAKARVIWPLGISIGWLTLAAEWIWALEMVACKPVVELHVLGSNFAPLFWNHGMHALWHYTSALVAFLITQLLVAAHGLQRGWGFPCIRWFGVPYVAFLAHVD